MPAFGARRALANGLAPRPREPRNEAGIRRFRRQQQDTRRRLRLIALPAETIDSRVLIPMMFRYQQKPVPTEAGGNADQGGDMRIRLATLILLVTLPVLASAQNNSELMQLFRAGQAARQTGGGEIDWSVVGVEDAERRRTVLSILRAGGVRTALDYYNAAMIFQHGESVADIRLAHALATISARLDSASAPAKWLTAASWDRLLLNLGQPQWYGTQYVRDDSGKWMLYEVDPDAVTDEQRAALSVPPLAEAESRVALMNAER